MTAIWVGWKSRDGRIDLLRPSLVAASERRSSTDEIEYNGGGTAEAEDTVQRQWEVEEIANKVEAERALAGLERINLLLHCRPVSGGGPLRAELRLLMLGELESAAIVNKLQHDRDEPEETIVVDPVVVIHAEEALAREPRGVVKEEES